MKRILIATIVGTLIFFGFQATMWMSGMNDDFMTYSEDQDTIMSALSSNLNNDALYVMPVADPNASLSQESKEQYMQAHTGKPWAMVFYHTSMRGMDPGYIIKGMLYSLIATLLVTLILTRTNPATFGSAFQIAMSFGVFTLLVGPLNQMNWWEFPWSFIKPQVMDMLVGWGLTSLWLAKYVRK